MLRINLVPEETIRNTLWWTLPCVIGTLVALVCIVGVRLYLDSLKINTTVLNSKKTEINAQIESLKEKNKEFDPLNDEVTKLATKIEALQQITTSKLATYKPLIILELIQKLKPDQIWFTNIMIDRLDLKELATASKKEQELQQQKKPGLTDRPTTKVQEQATTIKQPRIVLSGSSIDPEAISKFIERLERTKDNMVADSDIRTKIYFKDLKLSKLNAEKKTKKEVTTFELTFDYVERDNISNLNQKDI